MDPQQRRPDGRLCFVDTAEQNVNWRTGTQKSANSCQHIIPIYHKKIKKSTVTIAERSNYLLQWRPLVYDCSLLVANMKLTLCRKWFYVGHYFVVGHYFTSVLRFYLCAQNLSLGFIFVLRHYGQLSVQLCCCLTVCPYCLIYCNICYAVLGK